MPSERAQLILYGRGYCHLCDDMIAELKGLADRYPFDLEIIDVDADPALEERYGELVPVLMAGEREICHYHLDAGALDAFFAGIR